MTAAFNAQFERSASESPKPLAAATPRAPIDGAAVLEAYASNNAR